MYPYCRKYIYSLKEGTKQNRIVPSDNDFFVLLHPCGGSNPRGFTVIPLINILHEFKWTNNRQCLFSGHTLHSWNKSNLKKMEEFVTFLLDLRSERLETLWAQSNKVGKDCHWTWIRDSDVPSQCCTNGPPAPASHMHPHGNCAKHEDLIKSKFPYLIDQNRKKQNCKKYSTFIILTSLTVLTEFKFDQN